MKLLTKNIIKQLIKNGQDQQDAIMSEEALDFKPVVKLFTPDANATWLLTELDPKDPSIAFGLCDLGLGFPELGSVSIAEIEQICGHLNLKVERDESFQADKTLSEYTKIARQHLAIVT